MLLANMFRTFFALALLLHSIPSSGSTVTREDAVAELQNEVRQVQRAWFRHVSETNRAEGSYLEKCRSSLSVAGFPLLIGFIVTANVAPRGAVLWIALALTTAVFAVDALPLHLSRRRALREMQMEEIAPMVVGVSALFRALLNGEKQGDAFALDPLRTLLGRLGALTHAARRTGQVRLVLDKMWLDLIGLANLVEKSQSSDSEFMEPGTETLRRVGEMIRREAKRAGVAAAL